MLIILLHGAASRLIFIAFSVLVEVSFGFYLGINKQGDISFLDTLLQTFFEIPENFIQIKRTVTDVLDEVAYLLSHNPTLLFKSFNYLIQSLDNPIISSKIFCKLEHCSVSLKTILTDNKKIFYQNKADLLKSKIFTKKVFEEKLKENAIKFPNFREIIDGIVEVVSLGQNSEEVKNDLVTIYKPYIQNLIQAKGVLDTKVISL
jgi:hypothetical protein